VPYSVNAWPRFDSVQGITGIVRALFYYRMHKEFGFVLRWTRFDKFTVPKNLYLISRSRYLFQTIYRAFIPYG